MSQFWLGGSGGGGSGSVLTLTGNSGGAVGPNGSGNINLIGSGGITITGNPGTNTLTVTGTTSSIAWTDEATSFLAVSGSAYFASAALTMTLPASPIQGDVVILAADTSGTVVAQANTGQTIQLGGAATSSGGTATSSVKGNSLYLVYRAADTEWFSIATTGSWILA